MLLIVQAASFAGHDSKCRVLKRRSDRFAISIIQSILRNLGKSIFLTRSLLGQAQVCDLGSLNRGRRAWAQNGACLGVSAAVTIAPGKKRP